MIGTYLNQTAGWKPLTGFDGYGKEIWGDESTIAVRWESRHERIINPQGAEVLSKGVFYCKEPIMVGDAMVFRGETLRVLTVSSFPGFDGAVVYREVLV